MAHGRAKGGAWYAEATLVPHFWRKSPRFQEKSLKLLNHQNGVLNVDGAGLQLDLTNGTFVRGKIAEGVGRGDRT